MTQPKKRKTNGQLMADFQKGLGYTNDELAKALSVSPSLVIAWRRNPQSAAFRIPSATVLQLAGFLLAAKNNVRHFPHLEY